MSHHVLGARIGFFTNPAEIDLDEVETDRVVAMEVATAMDGQEALSMLRGAVQAARPYRLALLMCRCQ